MLPSCSVSYESYPLIGLYISHALLVFTKMKENSTRCKRFQITHPSATTATRKPPLSDLDAEKDSKA